MNQEKRKNIDEAKKLTVQPDTQEEKETRETKQSKILEGFYSLLVTLITVLISSSIIVFFDIYNKNNLASYKIFDAELKYSLDAVLKKYCQVELL